MTVKIERKWKKKGYTIGVVSINGKEFCHSLEPEDRGFTNTMSAMSIQNAKHWGQTAIPTGKYEVQYKWSPKYAKLMPKVMNVPGFDGILFHSGNTAADTRGCILLGKNTQKAMVTNSRYYTRIFRDLVADCDKRGEKVELEIG